MELQEVIDILELHRYDLSAEQTELMNALERAIELLRDHLKWHQIIGELNSVGIGYPVFVEDLKKVLEKESED